MGHRVDEPLVELWGPHEAGALEGAGGLVAGDAGAEFAGVGEVGGIVGESGVVGRGGEGIGGRGREVVVYVLLML